MRTKKIEEPTYLQYKKYAKGGELNTYKNKYNRKYGYPENESHNLEQISKDTGVSLKGLQQIYNKGIGAYKTNPESVRKNVHSKEQWAMGRVYSAVMGGKASKVDANELKMAKGGLLAPNGKASNLTAEQWKLVRTPEFKNFFGDWENDPENASKVVDENGEPLVVYHGTDKEFNVFDFDKADLGFHFGTYEQAKNRAENKLKLKESKAIIRPFFINIKNVYELTDVGEWEYPQRYIDTLISYNIIDEKDAKRLGFFRLYQKEDNIKIREYLLEKYKNSIGFIYNNEYEGKGQSFIILNSAKIKIADGTNTTFDANNPDIRYEEGGEIQSMINEGIVEIEFYDTTIAHAKKYGIESKKPLYVKKIFVSENNINKGIGKKLIKYLYDYAVENGNDVIFGHIATKASYIGILKHLLLENGYTINDKNNDFYIIITKENKYEEGGLLAPNGKKSNLTAEQWHLVRTPAFKKFFGDWENDPENASKVVDENGEPLVVYRGFNKKNDKGFIFKYGVNRFSNRLANRFAHYFTRSKNVALEYAEQGQKQDEKDIIVKSYFLNSRELLDITIKNPKYPKFEEWVKTRESIFSYSPYDIIEKLKKREIPTHSYLFESVLSKAVNEDDLDELSLLKIKELELKIKKDEKEQKNIYKSSQTITLIQLLSLITNKTLDEIIQRDYNENDAEARRDVYEWFINHKSDRKLVTDDLDVVLKNLIIDEGFDGGKFMEHQFGVKNEKDFEVYFVFDSEQIKLSDGTNTTFDANNPDIRYEQGGDLKKSNIISLPDTYSSYDSLKPILENQGYELIKKNNLEMSTEKLEIEDNRSVSELDMKYPELPHSFINEQLMAGIKHEMEHTEDPRVAKKISIDHLLENIHYYEYLAEMEQKMQGKNIDEHYDSITKMYEEGGKVETFEFSTPTGKTSKLNYLQQVLVRTKAFKNFFGDWELAARNYQTKKLEFDEAYKNVSKCIDYSTLEPRVVYHGTQADKEFFTFDVTQEKKIGRPYAYFAYNREYSLNFSGGTNKGYMYAVFLNIRNPFNAQKEWLTKPNTSAYFLNQIKSLIQFDKYGDNTPRKELSDTVDSQIKSYIQEVYADQPYYFWLLMARDVNKEFKYFLMSHGYDGIFSTENFTTVFDRENPSEFTFTYIAFDANQIKLADGRNIDFDSMNADIRYEDGGKTVEKVEVVVEQEEPTQNVSQIDYLRNNLRKFSEKDAEINQTIFKSGGHVQKDSGSPDDAKDGGLFVGRSHATGGIKAINLSTNQPIEVEGGEVIITKPAVEDQTKREFEGKMMTNKEILSHINQSGGGVSFEKGGEMGNSCGCSGKMYKFGGETISDYMVLRKISTLYDESIKNVKNYVDNLSEQFK